MAENFMNMGKSVQHDRREPKTRETHSYELANQLLFHGHAYDWTCDLSCADKGLMLDDLVS
jgi:hypothetical protein